MVFDSHISTQEQENSDMAIQPLSEPTAPYTDLADFAFERSAFKKRNWAADSTPKALRRQYRRAIKDGTDRAALRFLVVYYDKDGRNTVTARLPQTASDIARGFASLGCPVLVWLIVSNADKPKAYQVAATDRRHGAKAYVEAKPKASSHGKKSRTRRTTTRRRKHA